MHDKVPVPTDNVYKFYALFSLVTLIFCAWMATSLNSSTNAIVFKNYPETAELKSIKPITEIQQARLDVLEYEVEVATNDRRFYNFILGGSMGIAIWGIFFGFKKWHMEIQPLADAQNKAQLEILQLQIEKLRLENIKLVESLKAENAPVVLERPSLLEQVATALLSKR